MRRWRRGHAPADELLPVGAERDGFDLGAAQVESYAHVDLASRHATL